MNELTMNLKTDSKVPLYEQIYNYRKSDIQNGRISYGEKLPSTRALARHLEISRSTAELAYEQLLSEGYIESEPCRGYFVAKIDELYQIRPAKTPTEEKKEQKPRYRYDFTPNGVDLKSFPYNAWRKLSKDILTDDKTELFRSGESKGELGFRQAICNYLHQARGVNCTPGQVIVGAGSDYILMLLGMILGREHVVAFENPTYKQAYRLFRGLAYKTVPVGMDKNGMKVTELSDSGADIAYVTPSHQYPTGIIMPIGRRMELLKWAKEEPDRYVIEDDYDSEFRYTGRPIPTLQSIDDRGRVIYLNTFSQTISPSMRLGFLVLPPRLLERYRQELGFYACTVPALEQHVLTRFIAGGHYERHLSRMRKEYRDRRSATISAFRASPLASHVTFSEEGAGLHFLLRLDTNRSDEELRRLTAEAGIRLSFLSEYAAVPDPRFAHTLVINYAGLSQSDLEEALQLLTDVLLPLLA